MTNPDNLQLTDQQRSRDTSPLQAEVSRSHLLAVGIGLTAILAMTATGCIAESLRADTRTEVADPEMRLRTLAREAILSGPDSPDNIINTCTANMNGGAYKAMYSAIDDAIRNQELSETTRNDMNRASYVSIETSAVIINETLHDHTTSTGITLFYKDIDNDNIQEILGVTADPLTARRPCQT